MGVPCLIRIDPHLKEKNAQESQLQSTIPLAKWTTANRFKRTNQSKAGLKPLVRCIVMEITINTLANNGEYPLEKFDQPSSNR